MADGDPSAAVGARITERGRSEAMAAREPGEMTIDGPHTYRPALDGLRAVAVLLVMSEHLRVFAFPNSRLLPPGGYIGVDVFFVLSGFLITSLLLAEREDTGGVSLRGFYRRRAFRLLPALAVFMVVQAAAAIAAGQSLGDEVRFWVGAGTYTMNWLMALNWSVPANTGHLWSLAIEEQFYLLWPLVLILVIGRWGRRSVGVVALAGIGVALATRTYLSHRWGYGYPTVYLHTETRLDGLLLGGLLAWARQAGWRPPRRAAHAAGWVGLAVLAAYVTKTNPTDAFLYTGGGYTLLVLAAAMVTMAALEPTWLPTRILSFRLPVYVGRLSYSLYLWHFLVLFVLLSFLQRQRASVAIVLFTAASLVVAMVSHRFVESPLRMLGRTGAAAPEEEALHRPATTARRRRPAPAWALAGAGVAVLVALGVVPAYAARDDIQARDDAVAAAVAQREAAAQAPVASDATPEATPDPAGEGGQPGADPETTTAPTIEPASPTSQPGPPPTEADARAAVVLAVAEPALSTPTVPPTAPAVTLAATLTDAAGSPVSGRLVHFESAAGSCDATTDVGGLAVCGVAVSIPGTGLSGVDVVTARFDGDDSTLPARSSWP